MAEYDIVAIVGVGLIGGSIGLAMRERGLAREVIGIGRRTSTLEAAERLGAIDRGTTDVAKGVSNARLVAVCTPVNAIAETVARVATACPQESLIIDAGSTKEDVVAIIDAALSTRRHGPRFVGSHPLAGDHRGGPEHSRADLFDGRTVVITPTDETRPAAALEATGFWQSLGAKVVTMAPAEHDAALAMTSHLPHLVAAALAAATAHDVLPLAASGWRDTTRVAGGDAELWRPIFATNRQHVLAALDRYNSVLAALRDALEQGDDEHLVQILERAKQVKAKRDALGD